MNKATESVMRFSLWAQRLPCEGFAFINPEQQADVKAAERLLSELIAKQVAAVEQRRKAGSVKGPGKGGKRPGAGRPKKPPA